MAWRGPKTSALSPSPPNICKPLPVSPPRLLQSARCSSRSQEEPSVAVARSTTDERTKRKRFLSSMQYSTSIVIVDSGAAKESSNNSSNRKEKNEAARSSRNARSGMFQRNSSLLRGSVSAFSFAYVVFACTERERVSLPSTMSRARDVLRSLS